MEQKKNNEKKVSNPKFPRPILKWVGGKTQILDTITKEFPSEMNNYHEIFLGGGSVLLALLSLKKSGFVKVHGNVFAYDLNEPFIYTYKNIQSNHVELYDTIQTLITPFNNCGTENVNRSPANLEEAKGCKENYFYYIRSEYNKMSPDEKKSVKGSAMFIFLNKTCFRGVFRVGPKGFNVPYGHYNNVEIINKAHLEEVHDLIKDVVFECSSFDCSLPKIREGDFAYLDPPYAPESDNSFVGYTEHGFSLNTHLLLFEMIHKLAETDTIGNPNKKILLSNSDVPLVRENFDSSIFKVNSIVCKRSINSKNPSAKTMEVLIKNY